MDKLSNVHFEHPTSDASGYLGVSGASFLEPISESVPLQPLNTNSVRNIQGGQ